MKTKLNALLQKKSKWKRVSALAMVLFLLINNVVAPNVVKAASSTDRYKYTYSIEDLLTYFQYVTKGNCTLGNHTVGPVAVGGTFDANNVIFGDGAKTASYANVVTNATAPSVKDSYAGTCSDFYYGTSSMSAQQLAGFTQNAEYMNIAGNFSVIENQSSSFTNGASAPEISQDNSVIEIDFTKANKYNVTYAQVYAANRINIKFNSADDIKTNQYVLNFIGFENVTEDFWISAGSGASGLYGIASNKDCIAISWNDSSKNYIKEELSGPLMPSQEVNLGGMKFIMNFPDATNTLVFLEHGGHVVAPKASVAPASGRFEGGIIAKTVLGGGTRTLGPTSYPLAAQAHYYPYNVPENNSNSGSSDDPNPSINCDDIVLEKKYVVAAGGVGVAENEIPTVGNGPKFTLFNYASGEPVKGAQNIEPKKVDSAYKVTILGNLLTPGTEYYLQETTPAVGFELNSTKYYCKIDANGNVSYKDYIHNGYNNGAVLTCENIKNAQQEIPKGSLKVTVKEKNSTTMINDVAVTITGPSGTQTVKTDAYGTVTVSDLTIGTYTVEIPSKIGSYQTLVDNEKLATVNASTPAEVLFELEKPAPTGNLTIEVKDNQDNLLVPGAKVTVTYPDNSTKVHTATNGKIELTGVPVGKYTSEIKELPAGYKEATVKTAGTTVVENQTAYMLLKVDKVGSLKVVVKEENSSTKVGNVSVKITGANNYSENFTTTTANDILVKDLPIGNYTVTISKDNAGYVSLTDVAAKKTDSVKANDTTEYVFELEKEPDAKGNLTIKVTDEKTGKPVPGATVVVTYPDGKEETKTTNKDGIIELPDVPTGSYTTEIKEVPDGYTVTTDEEKTVVVNKGDDKTVEYKVDKAGSLKVIVKEKNSTTKVGKVTVKVTGTNYSKEFTTSTTSDILVEDLPIGNYTVTISKDNAGYVTLTASQAQKADAVKENATTEYVFELEKEPDAKGNLTIKVTDEETGKPVPGATVVVTYPNGKKETHKTDKNGEISLPNVPTGNYTTEITEVPDGYTVTTDEEKKVTVNKDDDKTIEYKVDKAGSLKVIVKEKNSTTKVGNVTVKVTGTNYSKEFTTSTTSDILVEDLPIGNYTVTISKDNAGYVTLTTSQAQKADAVKENATTEYVFELEKDPTAIGNLTIKVTDEETGKPVPGATVVVTHPNGKEETKTTDENGEIKLPNVPAGSYTTEVKDVPDGYTVTTDDKKTVVVNKGEDKSIEHKVDKPVPQPGKGNLTITVTDEKTGAAVPGATVKVTDPSEKTTEYTTDANGQIKLTNVPAGKYTTEITKVPAGYTVTTNTKTAATVEVNKTAQAEYKVGKTASTTDTPTNDPTDDPEDSDEDEDEDDKLGSLIITVEDEVTGDPVPNATVKVTYPNGKSKTYKSNKDGEIELEDVPAGNYQIEVTDVPDGYTVTLNKKSTAKVKKGDTAEKLIKVKTSDANTNTNTNTTNGTSVKPSPKPSTPAKVTSSQPKTGDDMNPMFFLVLFLVSAFALILSLFGLKRANRRERERQVTFRRQF